MTVEIKRNQENDSEAKSYVVHVKVLFIPSECLTLSPNVNLYILEDCCIQKMAVVLYVHITE